MIKGTGVDIVEIERVKKAACREIFRSRVYTPLEIEYCEAKGKQKYASYAARFAAKEAFLKAVGTGLRDGSLQDIEVYNDELGCPHLRVKGFWAEKIANLGTKKIFLSLSHGQDYAVAQCILEG